MNNPTRLVATFVLLGFMASCGSKAKTEETASAPAATPTETASTPEANSAPDAAPETVATAAEAATFDISQVPVSTADIGTFPYLSALKNYEVSSSNSENYDFERAFVYDGKNLLTVEGKVSQRFFGPIDSDKKASGTMIHRNYEALLKELGATKVFAGPVSREAIEKVGQDDAYKYGKWSVSTDHDTDAYVIRQKDKEVWVQVTSLGSDGNYNLTVIERAAMPQQATIIKADELKKN